MTDLNEDTTLAAVGGDSLVEDTGERTSPTATAAGAASRPRAGRGGEEETLLRTTLETVRVKAEELNRQSREWALARGDRARDLIEERPLTVVASAFAVGLLVGALAGR